MKTIVHITSVHNPFDNRIFEKMGKTARDAGYKVILIAPYNGNVSTDSIQVDGTRIYKSRLLRVLIGGANAFVKALKHKGDIYQIHDPELMPWLQLLRLLRKKVIYDMHENVPAAILSKYWIPEYLRRSVSAIWRRLERIALWRIPVIFAENSYQRHYPWIENYEIVLNMPNLDVLLNILEQKYEAPTVGYVGRVAPERGSLVTLDALSMLQSKGKTIEWVCIGDASEEHIKELKQAADDKNLKGVWLKGYMRSLEAWKLIARCNVGLAVLGPVPNYLESYPTKIFEYMALGIPVIASNFSLYKGIVEKNQCGLCIEPENADQLSRSLEWMIENQGKARVMGERGKEAVKSKYNWANEKKKLLAFYRRLDSIST